MFIVSPCTIYTHHSKFVFKCRPRIQGHSGRLLQTLQHQFSSKARETNIKFISQLIIFCRIRRIINYVDDTASPMLRNRNSLKPQPQLQQTPNSRAQSPLQICESSPPLEPPKSPFKTNHERISDCLTSTDSSVDLDKLMKLCWNGVPIEFRAICWKMLMKYLPPNLDRHESVLNRKRREYRDITFKYFGDATKVTLKDLLKSARSRPSLDFNDTILHQISIDIPRTCPESTLFQNPKVQGSLLRILYCWSIRRPATGYVQGINDLVTPFYCAFLPINFGFEDDEVMFDVEADTFWCLSNLLDTIQDSYTFNQSGIYRQVSLLREITLRMDPQLVNHLESEGVQFIQFAFRWMNCLLLREFPLPIIQRLWDSYLAEGGAEGFKTFHPYVCAAFLLKWRKELSVLEFQDVIVFLQRPPTANWTERDVEMLVAEAFVLKSLFNK